MSVFVNRNDTDDADDSRIVTRNRRTKQEQRQSSLWLCLARRRKAEGQNHGTDALASYVGSVLLKISIHEHP